MGLNLLMPLQKPRHAERWRKIDWLMLGCFGSLIATHLASVIVLSVMGSVPAHYYSQAALLGTWCLTLVRTVKLYCALKSLPCLEIKTMHQALCDFTK